MGWLATVATNVLSCKRRNTCSAGHNDFHSGHTTLHCTDLTDPRTEVLVKQALVNIGVRSGHLLVMHTGMIPPLGSEVWVGYLSSHK
ncbi:hypothetical protein PoB_005628800 [Plakobranchus ocellatus]|uniref:Ferrous iron transport protein A n=1 Tax=Plakobranchus ocellatus TaxID=259542 RepID=A0AAV4CD18_9GAST|nr:hypothetical protein PoB_005628800 [Plakobranchus ocellatus]